MALNRFADGAISALAGATIWGFSGSCAQFLFERTGMPPLLLVAIRMVAAGLVLLGALLLLHARAAHRHGRDGRVELVHPFDILRDRRSLAGLLVFGVIGLFSNQITYMYSIHYTNAGTATVLQTLNVVFVMGATCATGRRLPRAVELAGVACAVGGTYLIATGGDPRTLALPLIGLAWGLGNAAGTAFYTVQPRLLFERWGSAIVTAYGMLFGGIAASAGWLLLPDSLRDPGLADAAGAGAGAAPGAGAAFSFASFDAEDWIALVTIVLVGTLGAYALFLRGVANAGGFAASLLGSVEPVSATVFAAVWLATPFSWADWAGMALMVLTVVLVTLGAPRDGRRRRAGLLHRLPARRGRAGE